MERSVVGMLMVILLTGCVSNEFIKLETQPFSKSNLSEIDFSKAKQIVEGDLTKTAIEDSRPFVTITKSLYGKYDLYEISADSGQVVSIVMEGYVRTGITSVVTSLILQPYVTILDVEHAQVASNTSISFIPMDYQGPKRIANSTTFEAPSTGKYYLICSAINQSLMDISKSATYGVIDTGITLEKYGPAVTGKYAIKVQK